MEFAQSGLTMLAAAFGSGVLLAAVALGWRLRRRQAQVLELREAVGRARASEDHMRERMQELQHDQRESDARFQAQERDLRLLEQEHARLQAVMAEKDAHYRKMESALEDARNRMRLEFQDLANRILEEKGKTFSASSQTALEGLLRPFREQIEAFQKRVNHIHDETLRGNASLGSEIRRIAELGLQLGQEAGNLSRALHGEKKTLGNWGELQLEQTLRQAGLVKGQHYDAQPVFQDTSGQRRQPDFVIHLPDGRHMVLDSKVSLVDYSRAVAAQTPEERQVALDAHIKALRAHVDDLAGKDYGHLNGLDTPGFVLMYLPVEAAWIAAMQHSNDLLDYGWRRNVIPVSHATLMPVLKTVASVWMMARSTEEARQLADQAGEIHNQVALVARRLQRLGGSLGTVSRHYNDAVTAMAGQQGLFGKVARFSGISSRVNRELPEIGTLQPDLQTDRLSNSSANPGDEE